MSDIIQVADLRHVYRRGKTPVHALGGVSFSVRAGEIFGLLGPNGAGKTTLVRILTTVLKPTSGHASIAGHDVVTHPLAVRRKIAAVLQENAVETLLTVWDNLTLYGYLHGLSRAETHRRAERAAEILELTDYFHQRAQALSGGYKRRLQVAKVLMLETPVLFLDEATTGMDPIIKRRVIEAIREQAARGRTVLLTTQLLDEAEALCDRMVLMDEGRCIASGTLADLRALSRKMFRIQLSFENDGANAAAALRELQPRSLEEKEGEYILVVEGTEDEWIRHMAKVSERWPLSHLEFRGASLEQIFLELYGHRSADTQQAAEESL